MDILHYHGWFMLFNATFNKISVMIVAVSFISGENGVSLLIDFFFSFSIADKSFTTNVLVTHRQAS